MKYAQTSNTWWEVFTTFLSLGCLSFGGPAAHLGYFQTAFVQKRRWLSQEEYAAIVALAQFLPGPASSQVGFAIGLHRAGLAGAIAAFVGFTLPSFAIMLALGCGWFVGGLAYDHAATDMTLIHALKLLAVVVVADATLSMASNFCTRTTTRALALFSAVAVMLLPSLETQIMVLVACALVGYWRLSQGTEKEGNKGSHLQPTSSPTVAFDRNPIWLGFGLLLVLPLFSWVGDSVSLFNGFYQAGSFVFGGGHVVLPLLQQSVDAQVSSDAFQVGYAAAQAVPGPMFTMATYLGAQAMSDAPIWGALLATVAVFLPGFLLVLAFQSRWQQLSQRADLAGALAGVNAAVVGLLIAALYYPVVTTSIVQPLDMACVLVGFFLLRHLKLPVWCLVLGFVALGVVL